MTPRLFPDGSAVLLVGNSSKDALPVVIGVDDGAGAAPRVVRVALPGHSFSTFVLSPSNQTRSVPDGREQKSDKKHRKFD